MVVVALRFNQRKNNARSIRPRSSAHPAWRDYSGRPSVAVQVFAPFCSKIRPWAQWTNDETKQVGEYMGQRFLCTTFQSEEAALGKSFTPLRKTSCASTSAWLPHTKTIKDHGEVGKFSIICSVNRACCLWVSIHSPLIWNPSSGSLGNDKWWYNWYYHFTTIINHL